MQLWILCQILPGKNTTEHLFLPIYLKVFSRKVIAQIHRIIKKIDQTENKLQVLNTRKLFQKFSSILKLEQK